jgi:hypothetical protein
MERRRPVAAFCCIHQATFHCSLAVLEREQTARELTELGLGDGNMKTMVMNRQYYGIPGLLEDGSTMPTQHKPR